MRKGTAASPSVFEQTNDPRPEGRGVSLNGHRPSASPESVSRAASDQLYRNFFAPQPEKADPTQPGVPRERSSGNQAPRASRRSALVRRNGGTPARRRGHCPGLTRALTSWASSAPTRTTLHRLLNVVNPGRGLWGLCGP